MKKKIVFSGIQPTGNLHLGNYLGAISQWVNLQDKYQCIFCVVDYHAITVEQDPQTLHQKTLETVKIYLASGINPRKAIIFRQSDIKEHTELTWLLNCTSARISDLNKMTQFKDKGGNKENVSLGLFDYPVLMAADILLYHTDLVPVGHDQVQHIELARDLAKRFNHNYGEVFKIPEAMLRKEGARIMGLDDASKKMSKSATSPANYLALTDDPTVAKKKIMKAQTDSENKIKYDLNKQPAVSNLLTIFSLLSGQSISKLEKIYAHKGYRDFKKDLANIVEAFLIDFQKKYNKISNKEAEAVLKKGAKKLRSVAIATIDEVKQKIGI